MDKLFSLDVNAGDRLLHVAVPESEVTGIRTVDLHIV